MARETIEIGWNLDNSYAELPQIFFSRQPLTPVRSPKLIILNHELAESLGFDAEALKSNKSIEVFAGNQAPENGVTIAQAYAGHQFGYFTMLGDGRALLLGEQITPEGERFDIQLKGSGKTPYSRGGDGRAALGPMLREYIISEAMYGLGIPTTRSLAVVTTGETIFREKELKGAVLTRVAKSHLRVGTFEYAAKWGNIEELRSLADYTLQRHFPNTSGVKNPYLYLLDEVIKRQAELIAKWQLVGFIHGVMNTDNMALSGETIDYGPCAFMDTYDPETVFSSIDTEGRYAYGNQPRIAKWNLARFAETLLPLLDDNESEAVKLAQNKVSTFTKLYYNNWITGMRAKLGIFNEETQDKFLIEELLTMMKKYHADYTNTFRALTLDVLEDNELFSSIEFKEWRIRWQSRLKNQGHSKEEAMQLMRRNNPALIPRNHRVEEALEVAEEKDYSVMERLIKALAKPYDYLPEQTPYVSVPEFSTRPYKTFCGT